MTVMEVELMDIKARLTRLEMIVARLMGQPAPSPRNTPSPMVREAAAEWEALSPEENALVSVAAMYDGEHIALDVDSDVARTFGEIKARLRRQGGLIEDFDLLSAATALAHDLILVTNNVAHFARIAGLTLENWAQA